MLTPLLAIGLGTVAVGAVIASIELLATLRPTAALFRMPTTRIRVAAGALVLALVCGVGVVVVLVTAPSLPPSAPAIAAAALAIALLLRALVVRGLDGSDRMLLFGAASMASWVLLRGHGESLEILAWLGLIGMLGLAYVDSAISKLRHRGWRSGRQLFLVMNTKEYGSPVIARILAGRPRISRGLAWAIMLAELTMPALLLLGQPSSIVAAVVLTALHLSIAVTMGLGRFVFPFVGSLAFVVAAHPW